MATWQATSSESVRPETLTTSGLERSSSLLRLCRTFTIPLLGKPMLFISDCSLVRLTRRGEGLPARAAYMTVPPTT